MDTQLKKQIMGRVVAIYLVRRFAPVMSFGVIFFSAILAMWRFVSFTNVYQNMPEVTNPSATYTFLTVAVQNTEVYVQVSLGLILAAMMYYAFVLTKRLQQRRGAMARV